MALSQPTISRIIFRVTIILATYLNNYVKFPTNQAIIQENRRLFKELGYRHWTFVYWWSDRLQPYKIIKY